MQITTNDLEKFQLLYEKYFNASISKQEATEKANKLLALIQTVYIIKTGKTKNEQMC